MKPLATALSQALGIVRHYPQLFVVFFGFALMPWIASLPQTPGWLDAVLGVVALGWFAARFEILNRALEGKSLNISSLSRSLWYYAWKLTPLVLALGLAILLPVIILGLWFGRWYGLAYLNNGLGLSTRQVLQSFLPALFNPLLWSEFFTQNIFTRLLLELFKVSVIVGVLVAKVAMVLFVVERYKVRESVIRAFYYLNEQAFLILGFVGLRVLGNIGFKILSLFFRMTLGWMNSAFVMILLLGVASVIVLILDLFILSYYQTASKKGFLERNLMRWWRSRGKISQ